MNLTITKFNLEEVKGNSNSYEELNSLYIDEGIEIELPKLRICANLMVQNNCNLKLPKLEQCEFVYIQSNSIVIVVNIERIKYTLNMLHSNYVFAPKLTEVSEIYAGEGCGINSPKLKKFKLLQVQENTFINKEVWQQLKN